MTTYLEHAQSILGETHVYRHRGELHTAKALAKLVAFVGAYDEQIAAEAYAARHGARSVLAREKAADVALNAARKALDEEVAT